MPATIRGRRLLTPPLTVLLTVATALAVVLTLAAPADAGHLRRERKVDNAFQIVRNQQGDPYAYGAAGPHRFDCSGLMYYAFRKAGIRKIPRTSSAQYSFTRRIKKSRMRRGDLVFFYDGGGIYHAGVFAGRKNGRAYVIHASRPGTDVKRDPIWTSQWKGGTLRFRR